MIRSISYDQHEILRWITELHTGPIDADVTYGGGNFYRKLPKPFFCSDILPKPGAVQADVRRLPVRDGTFNCVVFDPPFMARTGPGATLKAKFGEIVGTIRDLWKFYQEAMIEIYRVLKPSGWLIVKCQDGVLSGQNHFTHIEIYDMAREIGFKPIDLFILLAKQRMWHPHHKRQVHARKFHCYFWVMRKP